MFSKPSNDTAPPRLFSPINAFFAVIATLLVVLSWTETLDTAAHETIDTNFKRAIGVYAISRSLNGVISVAQGTEIAVQPVGVGVSLSVGEILDPLNDLIERFSWLVLLALASLGAQLLMMELFSAFWVNVAITIAAAVAIVAIVCRHRWPPLLSIARVATAIILIRFVFAALGLIAGTITEAVLHDRQDVAVAYLNQSSAEITALRRTDPTPQASSLLDRLGALADQTGESLDIRKQLETLKARAEATIEHLVDLIVVYLVETVILPLVLMFAAYLTFRLCWNAKFWQPASVP